MLGESADFGAFRFCIGFPGVDGGRRGIDGVSHSGLRADRRVKLLDDVVAGGDEPVVRSGVGHVGHGDARDTVPERLEFRDLLVDNARLSFKSRGRVRRTRPRTVERGVDGIGDSLIA